MSGISIRPMQNSDISEVARLEQVCFSSPWSESSLREFSERSGSIFLTAVLDDCVIVGYVGMYSVLDEGNITNVAVFPEYRRCKAADSLLKRLIELCGQNGIAFLTLEVRESNIAAINLYKKNGFIQSGLRKGYYDKPTENAVIMLKSLM